MNSAIAFAAINFLFIVILITGGEFGDGLHRNLITISIIPSLLFGIAFLDPASLKMSSVERELWWIEGILQIHDKPAEKIEERLRQAHKKSKFTTDDFQQILHNLSEIDQSLNPIAKELSADFGLEQ